MIFRHLLNMRSHPTWVRGLKRQCSPRKTRLVSSHPTWVRGLKLSSLILCNKQGVSRTLRGCVD